MSARDSQLARLAKLVERARARDERLSDADLLLLPRLYRAAATARAELAGDPARPAEAAAAEELLSRAHALLSRPRASPRSPIQQARELFLVAAPRALRAEWRLLLASFVVFYGLALLAGVAVARNLDLAPSLLDAQMVEAEMEQLAALDPGESFRGNFDFGLGESPTTSGWILVHNMGVGVLFFASALVPPLYLYLLSTNALMLGTYTAVAGHWGEAGSISSILWCHGTIEIQAIILAATAGLVLVRAFVRPGALTRGTALVKEGRQALLLLAPTFPMLFCAGIIEGFVSPHAPVGVRLGVAVASGLALLAWALGAGRPTARSG